MVAKCVKKQTKEYGRRHKQSCGHKLCPAGYEVAIINASELQSKIYPALSWEDDWILILS